MAFAGPQKGKRLKRIPSMVTDWGHWLMLHPESTAYDLFDGKRYPAAPLPTRCAEAKEAVGGADARLPALAQVLGVEVGEATRAYPLDEKAERACFADTLAGTPLAVFWYGPTKTAVAYQQPLGRPHADVLCRRDLAGDGPFQGQGNRHALDAGRPRRSTARCAARS